MRLRSQPDSLSKTDDMLLLRFITSLWVLANCNAFTTPNLLTTALTSSSSPQVPGQQLVLISGCTGTGKSTFGMEVAITKGILKCISTDTIRQVMKTYDRDPALHRSSFFGDGDPLVQWKETCEVLQASIDSVVIDALNRGVSLVLEGVHVIPDKALIDRWKATGGVAVGVVLQIPDPDLHRQIIFSRGERTTKGAANQINKFSRIRAIHDEMVRLGDEHDWLVIEQRPIIAPKPIDLLNNKIRDVWFEGLSRNVLSKNSII